MIIYTYYVIYTYSFIYLYICIYIHIYSYILINFCFPMRHAARTPPPPDFIDCCLLRLMLIWKLQNTQASFEVSARSYKLSEVFTSSMRVFCIEFGVRRFGGMQKTIPELLPESWKLRPGVCQIYRMLFKIRPWGDLG